MKPLIFLSFIIIPCITFSQTSSHELIHSWQFRQAGSSTWRRATVPGTVHTDLFQNKLIPDPFYRDNEKKLHWIDSVQWEYKLEFDTDAKSISNNTSLQFDGLDTYADVYLNGNLVLQSDNMFRQWNVLVTPYLKRSKNILFIRFYPALLITDSIARSRLPLVLPDNNRVYARKAQFQFGWDWGPQFIGCGIWKKISLITWKGRQVLPVTHSAENGVTLVQQKDSAGFSFYFTKNGVPVFIKGANWIPADIFLPRVKKTDYRKLLVRAKDAHMNMLRVWGGGVYEDDAFYDLCDELGIMVWQDFMFANGMYPGNNAFLKNVKAEVVYQVNRLKKHPCIVLWCGNNEIDEAWHNWDWQKQFNLHGKDSAKVWGDYKQLFEDSLRQWVHELDGNRPYIPSSPKFGWGNDKSFSEGDSHYWGLWWGLEKWENFYKKTGRFVSEYGMQAMPNMYTIEKFTGPADRHIDSPAIQWHQKASEGFKKLDHYLGLYFIDSSLISGLSLKNYTYLTQCLQYYILKNSIITHKSMQPKTMGTLLWQMNDCWPAISWSITDYSRQPKAGWYAVKQAYRDDLVLKCDSAYPKKLILSKPIFKLRKSGKNEYTLTCNTPAKYVFLHNNIHGFEISDNYFDLDPGVRKTLIIKGIIHKADLQKIKFISLYDIRNDK